MEKSGRKAFRGGKAQSCSSSRTSKLRPQGSHCKGSCNNESGEERIQEVP